MSYKPTYQDKKGGKIEGTLVDQTTKEIVIFCKVWIQNTSHKTTTDFDGNYLLDSIVAGKYTLCAFTLGYDTLKLEIQVKAGKKSKNDMYLKRAIQTLTTDPLENKMVPKK